MDVSMRGTTLLILFLLFFTLGCDGSYRESTGDSGQLPSKLLQKCDNISKKLDKLANNFSSDENMKSPSSEQNHELADLEAKVEEALQHIPTPEETERFINRFNKLNEAMTPQVQLALVKKLVAMNWNLTAMNWLARSSLWLESAGNKGPGDKGTSFIADALDLLDDGEAILADEIPDIKEELRNLLIEHQKKIGKDVHSLILIKAEEQLAGFESSIPNDLDKASNDFFLIITQLKRSDIQPGGETKKALKQIDIALRRIKIIRVLRQLESQKKQILSLESPTDKLEADNQLFQSANALRIELLLDKENSAFEKELQQLSKLCDDLTKDNKKQIEVLRKKEEKRREKYQAWALEQIIWVRKNGTVPSVDKKLNEILAAARDDKEGQFEFLDNVHVRNWFNKNLGTKLTSTTVSVKDGKKLIEKLGGYVSDKTKSISQLITREVMIKRLLPIDTRLLDQPVLELYNETWAQLWNSLEGAKEDHRLKIARAAVKKTKATLDNFSN